MSKVRKVNVAATPKKRAKKFDAWSYSRFSVYSQCPLKARFQYIDKIKEPPSVHLERGSAAHKDAEDYVKAMLGGLRAKFPAVLQLFKKQMSALLREGQDILVETQWGFDASWSKAEWFGDTVWCRMMLDLVAISGSTARVVDYKTGKVNIDNQKPQLSLYALGVLALDPAVEKVICEFWYLDHGHIHKEEFHRSELPNLISMWNASVSAMFKDRRFVPSPSMLCRWCHYGQKTLNLCKF